MTTRKLCYVLYGSITNVQILNVWYGEFWQFFVAFASTQIEISEVLVLSLKKLAEIINVSIFQV